MNTHTRPQKLPGAKRKCNGLYLLAGVALIALLVLVFAPQAKAEEAKSLTLDQIVAPDTLLYLKCSGVDELMKYSEQLDLVRLWNHPEFQAFFAETKAMIPQMLATEMKAEFPIKPTWDLLKGNIMASMSPRLAIFEEGAMPTPALAIDMTGKQDTFMATVTGMLGMMAKETGLEFGKTQNPYRGFELNYIGLRKKRMAFYYTTVQNLFVMTFNQLYLQDIIDRYLDKKDNLTQVKSYRTSVKRVHGKAAGLMLYCNLKPLINAAKPFCPYEIIDCLDAEGINNIDALSFATTMDKGGAHDSFFIHCPGEKKGIVKALFPHPVSKGNIAMVPPNAVLFWDFVFDPELIMKEVDSFVKKYIPEVYGEFREGMEEARDELGIDLEKELFGPIGSEVAFFVTMPMMLSIPDMLLAVDIDDEAGFMSLFNKLRPMIEHELDISESTFDGAPMYTLIIPEPGFPFSPTFMVKGGKLLVAGTAPSLMNYLNWVKKGEPGLAATEGFKQAMACVPKNATCIEYMDLRSGVEFGYNMALSFMPSIIAESGLPLDVAKLPMTETVKSHISNLASYTVADEDGIMVSGHWPLGTAALLGMAVSSVDYLVQNDLMMGLVMNIDRLDRGPSRNASPDLVELGITLVGEGQFEKAIAVLTKWIDSHPGDRSRGGLPWLYRGYCKLSLKRYAEGIEDYKQAAAIDESNRGLAYYNICCGYSCLNKVDAAIEYLEKAVEAGWYDVNYLKTDSDLNNIRDDERFKAILERKV